MKKLILLVLLIILVVVGVDVWQKKKWDMVTRFTVIDLEGTLKVISFDPSTKIGIILELPDNFQIDTIGGRGSVRAGVLKKASVQWGQKWAADSLADYMGISYVDINSNLSLLDRFYMWWWKSQVNWKTVKLEETSYVTEVKDPDGLKLLRLEEHWPIKAEEWFSSANLARETIDVSVINSTEVGGLGAHVARVIENAGLRVISVTNSQGEIGKCILVGTKTSRSSVVGVWLRTRFGCDWNENSKDDGIVLTIGSDYRKWWLGN